MGFFVETPPVCFADSPLKEGAFGVLLSGRSVLFVWQISRICAILYLEIFYAKNR